MRQPKRASERAQALDKPVAELYNWFLQTWFNHMEDTGPVLHPQQFNKPGGSSGTTHQHDAFNTNPRLRPSSSPDDLSCIAPTCVSDCLNRRFTESKLCHDIPLRRKPAGRDEAAGDVAGARPRVCYQPGGQREAARRFYILRFVLLNGFDLQQNYMRDVLHGVIESIDSPQSADAVQPLVRFLLDAGVDVNWQRKSDLYTALHVACCKNLYPIVYLLVLFGADVNAIAAVGFVIPRPSAYIILFVLTPPLCFAILQDDSMPLSCANDVGRSNALSKAEQTQKELLVSISAGKSSSGNVEKTATSRTIHTADTTASTKLADASSLGGEETPAKQSKGPILSFSSTFGIHCSIDGSTDNQHHEGIMFNTSDPSDLIEAKFQALDRTIKMMSRSKSLRTSRVASSEHLREIVETQKPTALLPTLKPAGGAVVTGPHQSHAHSTKTSRSQPNTSREEKGLKAEQSPPRPSTGRRDYYDRSTEYLPEKWVDPKQQRAEELLQDTWHVLRSKLLDERLPYERLECHLISSNIEEQAQFEDNQAYEDPGNPHWLLQRTVCFLTLLALLADPSGTAVHDAMPPPKRPLTSASLQPKKSKAHLSVRCRSASFNNSDYQSKNWFVRSALELNEHSQRAPKPRRKAPRQHSVITSRNHLNRQARKNKPSPPARVKEQPKAKPHEVEIAGESITKRQARAPKHEEPVSECPLPVPKVNDLSFYMLELRLVHPEPLAEWRFQASFSDMSVVPSKTVILDDLTLYGHVLRIIVTSISPVTRIVINTSVQFTRSPDEAVVEPSAESIRRHSEAVARQEASLLRVLARRNSSTTSIQIARRKKKTHTARLQEVPWRKPSGTDLEADNVASTASLAIDQCSPWSAGDQDDPTSNDIPTSMLEKMFALQLEEPRYPSPVASPRKGPTAEHLGKSPRPPMTTIDKKKMQLQHLRANMRPLFDAVAPRTMEGQVVELTEAEQAQHQLQMEQQLKSFWAKQLLEMEQLEVGSEQGAVPRRAVERDEIVEEPQRPAAGAHQAHHEVGRGRAHDQRRGARAVRQGLRDVHPGADAALVGLLGEEQAADAAEGGHPDGHPEHGHLRLPRGRHQLREAPPTDWLAG
ncbi:hypothetical protein ON010_g5063 [Phytophthora cinnamomi]|nr:hypothetical protein ON010_g5063 [Phytophthora cinnamomi]